ncbi:hypothetical protein Pcinc_038537 [Petrolisthes cinctipes]|uniref:Hyaluronan-mediated motility receptor C-terminal domain-containing protein n=1 Tax=Petrolisthes cinctipes TaxID=88211 RepID=A0AAE1BRM4_PETCI|nr:hypothetical protein Pcinc_038537 [Petrolisthes cinctipes]
MFSKAKIKRFNEEVGCAPPPTAYNPKAKDGARIAVTLEKSERWKNVQQLTPGPGAYSASSLPFVSPMKKHSVSSSRLNSSTVSTSSNGSATSNAVFLSPPKARALSRSQSSRGVRGSATGEHTNREAGEQLRERIHELTLERDHMKTLISQLESQLVVLRGESGAKNTQDAATVTSSDNSEHLDGVFDSPGRGRKKQSTPCTSPSQQGGELEVKVLQEQLDATMKELTHAQQTISTLTDERSGLQLQLKQLEESGENGSLSEEAVVSLKEELSHLTQLRDNLEASLYSKEDLIAELQLQLDEVVAEATSSYFKAQQEESRLHSLQQKLQVSLRERNEAEGRVRNLVVRYEGLMKEQEQQKCQYNEVIAKKDIEIKLLNASLGNLNSRIMEYETTISSLEDEVGRVPVLEGTVSELSLAAKERELTDTMHQEELNSRYHEVSQLEETIRELETNLAAAKAEKDDLTTRLKTAVAEKTTITTKLQEATTEREQLATTLDLERKRMKGLETEVKEKEVVQQFLEKEMCAREAELAESSRKLREVEAQLETTRGVALDLQQEAEAQLNQVLTLKATLSAKEYEIDAKSELISTLQEEMNYKHSETTVLQEKYENQMSTTEQVEEMLTCKEEQMLSILDELENIRGKLRNREDNLCSLQDRVTELETTNRQLEEKIVELMAEISDREAQHISRTTCLESEVEELGVKYSEALLDQEATRRVLGHTTEQLEQERLVRDGTEGELQTMKEEHQALETNMRDLVQKYTSLEDALACEEAENRDLEERLEREVSGAREEAATAQREVDSLTTTNNGFCTQITQLKIDMRKKCDAVEEMQQCIESLREERQHLTNLRDNLEVTVEARDETIAQLQLHSANTQREAEEERVVLRSRLADLDNHLKETQEEVDAKTAKIRELEDRVASLEEENLKQSKCYGQQLEEKTEMTTQLTAKLEDFTRQYDGYKDQLKNLETSLLDKTTEFDTHKIEMAASLETTSNKLKQEVEEVKKSRDLLNDTLTNTQGQLATLQQELEEKNTTLKKQQKQVDDLHRRGKELTKGKEMADKTISQLQENLNTTRQKLARLEECMSEEVSAEVSQLTQEWNRERQDLITTNTQLKEELNSWKSKFLHLEKIIEPFRDQLDAYEVEKTSLMERSSAAKEEVDKLSQQYAQLLGHQNHKQKIHHVLKLKKENGQLKEEVYKLRQEGEKQRKMVRRLEDKMRLCGSTARLNATTHSLGDKENSSTSFLSASTTSLAPPSPVMAASTPLRSSNRPHRL